VAKTRIQIARPDIVKLFDQRPESIFRRKDLADILSQNREFWRLAQSETVNSFVDFLVKHTKLRRAEFAFPHRKETRFTWGDVPFYELVQAVKPTAYFSHYTAMYFHELTDQIPKTVYLNNEQRPKPARDVDLKQAEVDIAFRRPPRMTSNVTRFRGYRICLINGKHSGDLGVVDMPGPDESEVRVTSLERTLIDITVRPAYSGGVFEVLEAYRRAHGRVSVNRLAAMLKSLDFVYPYDQAIGFYLERSAVYTDSQIRLLRKRPFEIDFYLTHNMKDLDYDEGWRLFYPKGL
jgi:hypothetical protein